MTGWWLWQHAARESEPGPEAIDLAASPDCPFRHFCVVAPCRRTEGRVEMHVEIHRRFSSHTTQKQCPHMEFIETSLPGVIRVVPKVFGDHRGFFVEKYHQQRFADQGISLPFVQDNMSRSQRGVLRGLHYQIEHSQGKLVTVLAGEIFDVAVDVRRSSPHFGNWTAANLSGENKESLYVPPGFAHGFYVLSESADVFYKCTDLYHPEAERTVLWNDPAIGVEWPLLADPILSSKDLSGVPLSEAECFE